MSNLDMKNLTRRAAPRVPFAKVAALLLPGWDISLVLATEEQAQRLNESLRKKTYTPNVLAYEAGKKSGEIILCLAVAKVEAPNYDHTYPEHVLFLFIHGLMHLKGMRHGATMERRERETLSRFISVTSPNGTTNRDRHRYRNASHENRRGRRG